MSHLGSYPLGNNNQFHGLAPNPKVSSLPWRDQCLVRWRQAPRYGAHGPAPRAPGETRPPPPSGVGSTFLAPPAPPALVGTAPRRPPAARATERRGDRRKSLPTCLLVGRDFRRVHSWVIRQSAVEPDGPGVDSVPVTPPFIRRSAAEPDEPLINVSCCPHNAIVVGFRAVLPHAYYQRLQGAMTETLYA